MLALRLSPLPLAPVQKPQGSGAGAWALSQERPGGLCSPARALLEADDAHPVDVLRREPLGLGRALQPHARARVVAVHTYLELKQL